MMYIRTIELFAECIPSVLIQTLAFVDGSGRTAVAKLSLASSILTAAYIATSMSIEKDANASGRRRRPDFYGFLPLEYVKRTITITLLAFVMCTCQVISKAFAIALCNVESTAIIIAYICIDFGIMYVVKISRGDLTYCFPVENKIGRLVVSILERLGAKTVLDFTGMLYLRHPFEMGGAYFSFTLLSTPVVCLYICSRYLDYVSDEEVKAEIGGSFTPEQVYGSIISISVLQMASFGLFLHLMNPSFRSTFLSLRTGSQEVILNFRNAKTDHAKFNVLKIEETLWKPIREEVRSWINGNLTEWIGSESFSANKRALIPDDLVDDPAQLIQIRGVDVEKLQRRRSSLKPSAILAANNEAEAEAES
eukprot:CAMPEP_0182514522 /NCGR_PEP_ID=MMETSP1321-20130603/35892_1 /TAXON_ID=91990 /ORGANISM="Bolidomonas sp., Strain RCC1657" /LENGTH=364 /DNA_ID=CAMNT_0024721731 /DNA_START=33 /DNA_END=1127 /DNA_ORIENTATION=+